MDEFQRVKGHSRCVHHSDSSVIYKVSVYINLMIQVSHIQGHEIRIVLYALLGGGDLLILLKWTT
jgi:hypothetical protein